MIYDVNTFQSIYSGEVTYYFDENNNYIQQNYLYNDCKFDFVVVNHPNDSTKKYVAKIICFISN